MNLINLNLISKYRSEIMGVATIMIIICHAPHYMFLSSFMSRVLSFWTVGVDMFLFLSGVGLCYSYEKKKNLSIWYRKRFFRILFPCFIVQLLFVRNEGIVDFVLFFTGISFWTNHRGFWFVDLLIILYLSFPVLFKISKCSRNQSVVLLTLFCIVLYVLPNFKAWDNAIMINFCMVCQRIPSFVLGILIFPLVQECKRIDLRYLLPFCILGTIVFVFISHQFQLQLYPGIFYSCIIIIACCLIFDSITKLKPFTFFGKISLESYLLNVSFPSFLLRIGEGKIPNCWWFYLFATGIGLIIATIVSKISQILLNKLKW